MKPSFEPKQFLPRSLSNDPSGRATGADIRAHFARQDPAQCATAGKSDSDRYKCCKNALKLGAIIIASSKSNINGTATIGGGAERVSKANASPPPFEPNRKSPGAYSSTL